METLIVDAIFLKNDNTKVNFDFFEKLKVLDKIVERKIILQNGKLTNSGLKIPDGYKNVIIDDFSLKNIISVVIKEAKNSDNVIWVKFGNPFIFIDYIKNMVEKHNKFIVDYSYAIGFPEGLIPEVVRVNSLKNILEILKDEDYFEENVIFNSLAKDINSFDIETYISNCDLRLAKLSIGLKDIGEAIFTDRLYNAKNFSSYDEIAEFLSLNFEYYYTVPYACFFQITNKIKNRPIYFPEIQCNEQIDINIEKFKSDIEKLKNINSNMTIIFGGIVEPLLHSDIISLMKIVLDSNFELIIETDGMNIDDKIIDFLKENSERISIVLRLDALNEEVYQKIYKINDLKEKLTILNKLKDTGIRCYTQIVRMKENEVDIEKLIREKKIENFIIRKYSTFCQRLEDRKVVDLSPVERFGCYSLRRELAINEKNQLLLCKYSDEILCEDFSTLENDDILNIMKNEYLRNSKKEYRKCCINCDDYYIFSF